MNIAHQNILILDDNQDICNLIKLNLEINPGVTVQTSNYIKDALEIIKTTEVDLLLLDLMLNNETGADALEQIKKIKSDLPVIIISATHSLDHALDLYKKGIKGFLRKPLDMAQLEKLAFEKVQEYQSIKTVLNKDVINNSEIKKGVTLLAAGFNEDDSSHLEELIGDKSELIITRSIEVGKQLLINKNIQAIFLSNTFSDGGPLELLLHAKNSKSNPEVFLIQSDEDSDWSKYGMFNGATGYIKKDEFWDEIHTIFKRQRARLRDSDYNISNYTEFNQLRLSISSQLEDKSSRKILITSPYHKNGKTFITWHLAKNFAARSKGSVLLVDLNRKNADLEELAGNSNNPGVSDILIGTKTEKECIISTDYKNLYLLGVGNRIVNLEEMDTVTELANLFQRLGKIYDTIIIDSSSLLSHNKQNIDPVWYTFIMDAVYLVVTPRDTRAVHLKKAIQRIEDVGGTVSGIITNYRFDTGLPTIGSLMDRLRSYLGKNKVTRKLFLRKEH